MLFKAYPIYICSLRHIFSKQHILFNNILHSATHYVQQQILLFNMYGLYDIYVQHIYVFKQHIYVIEFNQTYVCHVSLNIYVILM